MNNVFYQSEEISGYRPKRDQNNMEYNLIYLHEETASNHLPSGLKQHGVQFD